MNTIKIKEKIPFLQAHASMTYLDNAATTHKPQSVLDAMMHFYSVKNATVHRTLYPAGEAATEHYEQVREKVATFINAHNSSEIIFTKGTTEGINSIATMWAMENLKQGDEIVLTQAEHHANLVPWQRVAQKTGARLVFIPLNQSTCTVQDPASYLSGRTKLVAITADSNVIGPIWGDEAILLAFIQQAKNCGARILIDAAQMVAHKKLDVQKLRADFVVFSGHKMFGPTGIGVLYIDRKLHDDIEPYHVGGGMVHSVTLYDAQWTQSPHRFEAGTPPIAQVMGLGAALDFMASAIDFAELEKHEAKLCERLIDGLCNNDEIIIVGNKKLLSSMGHVVSMALRTLHPHDVAAYLGQRDIAVRAGHFCAQPLATALGFESLLRVSFAAYTSEKDVDTFIQALDACIEHLKKSLGR